MSKENRGGGLALTWKVDFDLVVDSSSLNHIDARINRGKMLEGSMVSMALLRFIIIIFLGRS